MTLAAFASSWLALSRRRRRRPASFSLFRKYERIAHSCSSTTCPVVAPPVLSEVDEVDEVDELRAAPADERQALDCQFAVDLAPSHPKWRHTWRFLI